MFGLGRKPHVQDVSSSDNSDESYDTGPGEHTLIIPRPRASLAPSLMARVGMMSHGPDRDPVTLDMAGNLGVKTDPYMIEVFVADKISGAIHPRGITGWGGGNSLLPEITGEVGALQVPHQYVRDVSYASDPGGRSDRTRDPSMSATVTANEMMQVDGVYVGSAV